MSSCARTVAVAEVDEQDGTDRRTPWDQLANGELAFDFSPRLTSPSRRVHRSAKMGEGAGVKEAIIRWLEEQM